MRGNERDRTVQAASGGEIDGHSGAQVMVRGTEGRVNARGALNAQRDHQLDGRKREFPKDRGSGEPRLRRVWRQNRSLSSVLCHLWAVAGESPGY